MFEYNLLLRNSNSIFKNPATAFIYFQQAVLEKHFFVLVISFHFFKNRKQNRIKSCIGNEEFIINHCCLVKFIAMKKILSLHCITLRMTMC